MTNEKKKIMNDFVQKILEVYNAPESSIKECIKSNCLGIDYDYFKTVVEYMGYRCKKQGPCASNIDSERCTVKVINGKIERFMGWG